MLICCLALLLALVGPIVLLVCLRLRHQTTLSWSVRLLFWVIAVTAFTLIASSSGATKSLVILGLLRPTTASIGWGLGAAAGLMLAAGVVTALQRLLGLTSGDKASFDEIVRTPLMLRMFVVLTAGIIEEVLYRGIGIGVGQLVVGGTKAAVAVSTVAFVAGHFRWRLGHLFQVAVASLILSTTFVLAGDDLWPCMLAHLLVDAIGFLLVPILLERRSASQARGRALVPGT